MSDCNVRPSTSLYCEFSPLPRKALVPANIQKYYLLEYLFAIFVSSHLSVVFSSFAMFSQGSHHASRSKHSFFTIVCTQFLFVDV